MAELGQLPPEVASPLPGTVCKRFVDELAASECPAMTLRRARRREQSGAPYDPIIWSRARGSNVLDVDGNRYVDLSAGFGAAAVGHAHPQVVEAVCEQGGRLLHALGDLHPSDVKVRLLTRLAALAPFADARVVLGLNGSDAVEAALKTAMLATGRPGVLAFEGGYHGLSYGALAACGYNARFRQPFGPQLSGHVCFAPYPRAPSGSDEAATRTALELVEAYWSRASSPIGAVLVEPVLGRGGVVVPPRGFVRALRQLCERRGALLIADEILTGLGRSGERWASAEAEPHLLCVGKALGGGLPVSACLGRAAVMDAWGDASREAIHTATFAGNPLGARAALAALDVIEQERLAERAAAAGGELLARLRALAGRFEAVREARGRGLLVGLQLASGQQNLALIRRLLERGYITVPAGAEADVLSLSPPLNMASELLDGFVHALDESLAELS